MKTTTTLLKAHIHLTQALDRLTKHFDSRSMLFALGLTLVCFGLSSDALAQTPVQLDVDQERLVEAVRAIFAYLEGGFGALVAVAAGLGAIFASAFGQYRASLGLLVVAVGSFILRSIVRTFFDLPGDI